MNKHTRKKPNTAREKSVKVHFQRTGKNRISKAGLIPVIKFLDKLGFTQLFQKTVGHERKNNAVYRLEDGVFLMLTGLIGALSISVNVRCFGQVAVYYKRLQVGCEYQTKQRSAAYSKK